MENADIYEHSSEECGARYFAKLAIASFHRDLAVLFTFHLMHEIQLQAGHRCIRLIA